MGQVTITTTFGDVGITISRDGQRALPLAFVGSVNRGAWAQLAVDGQLVRVTGSMILSGRRGWTTEGAYGGINVRPGPDEPPGDAAERIAAEIAAGLEALAPAGSPEHEEQAAAWLRQQIVERHRIIGELEARIATLRQEIAWHEQQLEPPPGPPPEVPPIEE